MSASTPVLFFPGLGDHGEIESFIHPRWRTVYFPWHNRDGEFGRLYSILKLEVQSVVNTDQPFMIVATSAGGTLGVNILKEFPACQALVCICSRLTIGKKPLSRVTYAYYQKTHPLFTQALAATELSLAESNEETLHRITSIGGRWDMVVPLETTAVPGIRLHIVKPIWIHARGIRKTLLEIRFRLRTMLMEQ